MTLFDNTYSTCKPGSADWYLKTSETHLDYDDSVGTAKNATLWFAGAPILYTPLASFPLNNQRRSGILHPRWTTSTRSGLDFTVPYYLNLAPNYDLTLAPRFLSKRGFQLGADARYASHHYDGQARVEYMPNDEMFGRSRYAYRLDHRQNLGRGFSTTINWNGVSDDYYWQDLTSRLLQTSQVQLPRQVELGYSPAPWLQTSMQVLRYQTLQIDPNNPISRPYFLEPQLNMLAYKPNVFKIDVSAIGQFSRFTHVDAAKVQGDRMVLYPQLSLPIVHPAFQITPKVGLHLSKYSLDEQASGLPNTFSRALPTFSLDSTVVFEREGNWFGKDYIQTLEPRLYYVNIPYKDQSQIPLFDTGLSDFNFAQIFSENRYSGYDRINDANQLTAGPDHALARWRNRCRALQGHARPALLLQAAARIDSPVKRRAQVISPISSRPSTAWSLPRPMPIVGLGIQLPRQRQRAFCRRSPFPARIRQGALGQLPLHP